VNLKTKPQPWEEFKKKIARKYQLMLEVA